MLTKFNFYFYYCNCLLLTTRVRSKRKPKKQLKRGYFYRGKYFQVIYNPKLEESKKINYLIIEDSKGTSDFNQIILPFKSIWKILSLNKLTYINKKDKNLNLKYQRNIELFRFKQKTILEKYR